MRAGFWSLAGRKWLEGHEKKINFFFYIKV
jgi:hypothetical protein